MKGNEMEIRGLQAQTFRLLSGPAQLEAAFFQGPSSFACHASLRSAGLEQWFNPTPSGESPGELFRNTQLPALPDISEWV